MPERDLNVKAQEGMYFIFELAGEEYGLEILQVREIIALMPLTAIPQVPVHIKGVVNLRGKVIPVVDLRLKFGFPAVDYTAENCIIILSIGDLLIGVIVDRVCDVVTIGQDLIEPPPGFNASLCLDFITGIGRIGDKVKILLNINKVLADDFRVVK
jgi:purine-binding chemotaxis protein CheW